MISMKEGMVDSDVVSRRLARLMVSWRLAWSAQEQHWALPPRRPFLASQAGRSHTNSHLGLGQVIGFLHFQSHLVASHIGVQTALGASHWVRQLAGEHTVSHLGQSFFSHKSLGQRTLHWGLSQWILHLAHSVSSQWIWHLGLSHTGWHWAGHTGSSHCHLHSGWQSPSTSATACMKSVSAATNETASKARRTNK